MQYEEYVNSRNPAGDLTGDEIFVFLQGGEAVQGTLNDLITFISESTNLVQHYRGVYDLSTEVYPSTGGSGPGGIPADGDYWIGGNSGDFDVEGFDDPITLFRGAMFYYTGGDVNDPASWVVKQ